jgi:hypothetical protein
MKAYKLILYFAVLVSAVSAFNYANDLFSDFPHLFNKSYLDKQDYVEQRYNGYKVYRYYDWIKNSYPGISSYGILTSSDNDSLYARYLHRMNYFLYPSYVQEKGPKTMFAPILNGINLKGPRSHKYASFNGREYFLIDKKDRTGLFILR